jgi:hypothetical protein
MITHTFKCLSDDTFAYMENDRLIIGENRANSTVYTYQGSIEAFINSRDYLKLAARNRPLLDDINDYYNLWKHDKKNQEDTAMNNTEALIGRLTKHSDDYYKQKTQDFEQVAKDCLAAADKLSMYSNSEITDKLSAGAGVESRSARTTKLCEIKVTEGADSLKELVFQLTANGYRVDVAPVYKEFPKTGLDYWMIAIFDKD